MYSIPLLSLIIFLPLVGALIVATIQGSEQDIERNAKSVALLTTLAVFVLSLILWQQFDPHNPGFQFIENVNWIAYSSSKYLVGVDGISILFVVLSAFLTPVCILASWNSIKDRVRLYLVSFLLLETFMIGMFCALDFVLFYVFFEGVLIPMFLIIGIWGGVRRIYASFKFFLYTLLGSVLMLVAILVIYHEVGTTDLQAAYNVHFPYHLQLWLWLAFFASFAVKIPMWPVHTWLPDAHVEAPTAGSVILAGVLLKMGGYGFLRFSLPLFPEASAFFAPFVFCLSVVAVIYTSLVALVQEDMKKLIAYSSVAHMGFVTLGIFTGSVAGVEGAIFQMLSHGVVSGALFLCVGVIYDRHHTREIAAYGGLVKNMPWYAAFYMLYTMASVGLPGTSGFIGEFLVIVSAFRVDTWIGLMTASGMVFGAAYALLLYRRVVFGKMVHAELKTMTDMNVREKLYMIPLAIVVLWMGIYPSVFFKTMSPSVASLLSKNVQQNVALSDTFATLKNNVKLLASR